MSGSGTRIGLIFSETGSYAGVCRSMRAAADLAIDEINASGRLVLDSVTVDPGGCLGAYVTATTDLLADPAITHLVGCYTSSSRKEILPVLEKRDALLWYPSHYEGFETSENVVYSGAAPNQHVIPLAKYLLGQSRHRGWLVGSNYVWAWENNRILREALGIAGGTVMGERYVPVGETDLRDIARQIVCDRPDFVFTTLIGSSLFAFLDDLRDLAGAAGLDQSADIPVASCSLSEAELPLIGRAAAGHLSSSVYFSTVDTPENQRFTEAWNARFSDLGHASADAEATYVAVHLLARAIERAGSDGFEAVREAARGIRFAAPQGEIEVDPMNLHCSLRPRIGISRDDGTFDIAWESKQPVAPDPYLTWTQDSEFRIAAATHLKVVP
ncbi:transporter substrate-binding domain-containing protein [Palleronia sp. LCG004]|uniref:transporter substrate-binding domain-containing protein n=1 Tax=Palleronia sp. LCG004 TaxID=3079304 RepID=UPI002943E6A5|nr:transporter substrate-binding domain-containing protein [Palleronia sp. LCG004]WOI58065.1 transporter substrate-binding domain-containing protein [Palleronia sp. LCG004]